MNLSGSSEVNYTVFDSQDPVDIDKSVSDAKRVGTPLQLPELSITAPVAGEDEFLVFTMLLDEVPTSDVVIDFHTESGTAQSEDYSAVTVTKTFPAGSIGPITVEVGTC